MTDEGRRERGDWRGWAIALLVVAGLFGLALALRLDDRALSTLAARRADLAGFVAARPLAAALAYVAAYATAAALALPGVSVLTVAGGFLFGAPAGAALATLGAGAGAALLFRAASSILAARLRDRAGPRLAAAMAGFHRNEVSWLLFLRLAAIFPFWLVNLAAAAAGARFPTFVWTTLLGVAPAAFAFALAGAGLDATLAAHAAAEAACGAPGCAGTLSLGALVSGELILAGVGLGLLALLPVALRRFGAHGPSRIG